MKVFFFSLVYLQHDSQTFRLKIGKLDLVNVAEATDFVADIADISFEHKTVDILGFLEDINYELKINKNTEKTSTVDLVTDLKKQNEELKCENNQNSDNLALTHKLNCLPVYRRCSRWIFHILGKNCRRAFPSCVSSCIRNKFASPDGLYTHFKFSPK